MPIPEPGPNEPSNNVATSSWYHETLEERSKPPDNNVFHLDDNAPGGYFQMGPKLKRAFDPKFDFLFPIIIATDRACVTGNQHYGAQPVSMTTSLLKEHVRRDWRVWRPLGYIPDTEKDSTHERMIANSSDKTKVRSAGH